MKAESPGLAFIEPNFLGFEAQDAIGRGKRPTAETQVSVQKILVGWDALEVNHRESLV